MNDDKPLTPTILESAIVKLPSENNLVMPESNPIGNLLERLKKKPAQTGRKSKLAGAFGGGVKHNHVRGWKRIKKK
jgi:hypothetical protein